MVYVLSHTGQPLMPTEDYRKVRILLKQHKAKVLQRTPFTIKLLHYTHEYKQPISLGVDAGSKVIGLSATTEKKELFASEVILRNDIVKLLSTRREFRRARRNRKKRYRSPRFDNRVHSKNKGWLAPSIENKIDTHLKTVKNVYKILPITNIVVETAAFDTQMLRAKELGLSLPKGVDYQQGEQIYSYNVREYVLFRDNHTCQHCKGKSKDPVLQVHHIESRKIGGDAPNNLITLCKTCHAKYHAGLIKELRVKRGASYRDAAFMGVMRWAFYDRLKQIYPNVSMTFGYITKHTRIKHQLEKKHYIDARCISGHPNALPTENLYLQKAVRKRNRQLHKATINKGGIRKNNQSPKYVCGFQLFDKVLYDNKECFIFGRRASGYFDIRMLDGTKLSASVSYKKLKLLERRKTILMQQVEDFAA